MLSPVRLTKKGLIGRAKAQGFDPSPHLVDDWVERGLLASPEREGRGRGKGVGSLWTEEQAQLFLLLLQKRDELDGRSLGPLYNIPVALWLLWGDRYASVSQVHRALGAWLEASGRIALRKAKAAVREHLPQLQHPDAHREYREYAFDVLVSAMRGDPDLESLRDAIDWLFDPHDEKRTIGPFGAPLTSETVVRLIEARLLAWQEIESISSEQFEIARLTYNRSLTDYQRDQPTLAQDSELGHLFERPTAEGVINNACLNLLTVIGLGLLLNRKGDPNDSARTRTS